MNLIGQRLRIGLKRGLGDGGSCQITREGRQTEGRVHKRRKVTNANLHGYVANDGEKG